MSFASRIGSAAVLFAAASWAQERPRDLKYEKDAPAVQQAAIPRGYALVVGIASYRNLPAPAQLKFPERDAESIYSILISPEGGNFRAENVHRLIGARATLAGLKHEIENWLPSVTKNDDRVLIYFAGHGFVYRGQAYLAPYDIDPNNIASTGYPMEALGRAIGSRIRGQWKVLLTDSCHSGAILPQTDAQSVNRSLLGLSSSLFSLTASRDRELSFESPELEGGHGVFTYYVVRGLGGAADENRDGKVTADELSEYVHRNVREATSGRQNPTSERGSFDPGMELAWVPSNASPAAPPPPKYGEFAVEVNMDGVEVLLDGKSVGVAGKASPLRLPGLLPGVHTIQGVRMGYEPDGPREEMVYPGQTTPVTLKILIPRRRPRAATDSFEKGLEHYNKGSAESYRKAAEQFRNALAADPNYSQAALYLARCHRDLFQFGDAQKFFRRAIEIDPDYLEARSTYAGALLDTGATDEAIRQLDAALRRDPSNAQALYMVAEAYRIKGMYRESTEAARKAIALTPNNAEAHFWLAESLRMSGGFKDAVPEYGEYLRLSDFDSKLTGKLNYYVLGYLAGIGRKKRAAQQDVWRDLRSLAYFGLCDSERNLARFAAAIAYCQKSLSYDPGDAFVHYALALSYARGANETGSLEMLAGARKHFRAMLDINPDIAEAEFAKKNLAAIDAALRSP